MKKYLYVLIFAVVSVAAIIGTNKFWSDCKMEMDDSQYMEVKDSKAKKLMIVAHPDDDTLWGGAHLIEDDYVVICITNGKNSVRSAEFKNVMKNTKDNGIILNYPDKVKGKRSDWKDVYEDIYEDLKKVIGAKEWELIVTHNMEGEYGHEHHLKTNEIVTNICKETKKTSELYYFGTYYKKSEIEKMGELPIKISDEMLTKKEEVLELYTSQEGTVKKLSHMNKFEDWTKYKE